MSDLTRPARCRPPLPLAVLALALMCTHGASAQGTSTPGGEPDGWLAGPLALKRTPQLAEAIPQPQRSERPTLITGDRITGQPDLETVIDGHASLRRGDTVIDADRLAYYQPNDLATANGHVHVNQAGNVYEGPELQLKLERFEGFFNNVRYRFLATGGNGDAERIDFIDRNRSVARRATYTTCRREDFPGWMPAWVLSAATVSTDTEEDVGVASGAQLRFMGITTPALPSLSFPLSSTRKSGLLPPVVGLDSVNGFEYSQPWYWNIAPNRDATFTPTVMSRRGVNLSSEFRYIEDKYNGEVRLDYMPTDRLRGRARWGLWTHNQQTFDAKSLGLDSLTGSIALNRVSDNNYWQDFTGAPLLAQRLLPNDGSLGWSKGDWSGQVRALSYQTLQYNLAPIVPPYDRMPQITANYNKYDWHGFDVSLNTDYSHFRVNPTFAPLLNGQAQPNGERAFALAQISRPWITPYSFVIPKLMLNATSYRFDAPLADGATTASRVVPTVSLDSGLIFERDSHYFNRAFTQTLEPRAFYVYTPYRDQRALPNYDSAFNDFNSASAYTENEFSGNDRISATHALTLGATTRLIDPDSGAEAARFGVAQRLRLRDQDVTLPGGLPSGKGLSDVLLDAQVNWTPQWSAHTSLQYNPDTGNWVRASIGGRYSPAPYRTVNVAYRYQADSTPLAADGNKSIDLGWQWPLNDLWGDRGKDLGPGRGQGGGRWYAVGRLNYSLRDRALTDALAGIEYDGCCWIGRVVLQRLTTGLIKANTRIMFQIEFVGFSSIGSSPLRSLQQNVPRYMPLRAPTAAPSRFTNYD